MLNKQFEVGDKVKIVGPIGTAEGSIGDVGKIKYIEPTGKLEAHRDRNAPYEGEVYEVNGWWYGQDALELVEPPTDRQKVKSDGGSTEYYKLPEHATELRHLISHKGMSKSRGDIFKACYRLGEKKGVDVMYELNKMEFFVQDLKEMYERGELI